MDVSKAFPFLSLGFVIVSVAARIYLREEIPLLRWGGVALIVGGVALVAGT